SLARDKGTRWPPRGRRARSLRAPAGAPGAQQRKGQDEQRLHLQDAHHGLAPWRFGDHGWSVRNEGRRRCNTRAVHEPHDARGRSRVAPPFQSTPPASALWADRSCRPAPRLRLLLALRASALRLQYRQTPDLCSPIDHLLFGHALERRLDRLREGCFDPLARRRITLDDPIELDPRDDPWSPVFQRRGTVPRDAPGRLDRVAVRELD